MEQRSANNFAFDFETEKIFCRNVLDEAAFRVYNIHMAEAIFNTIESRWMPSTVVHDENVAVCAGA